MQRIHRRTAIIAAGAVVAPYVKPRMAVLGAPAVLMVSAPSHDGHTTPIHHVAVQEADRLRPFPAGAQERSRAV